MQYWPLSLAMLVPVPVLLFLVFRLVEEHEDAGKDGAADAVPCARDGAGKYGERLCGKEGVGKNRCQSGVLHAHLDGQGALLGGVEMERLAGEITETVAEGVMAEHYGEGPEEEFKASLDEWVVDSGDDTTYDTCEADDRKAWHIALDDREILLVAVDVV